MKRYLKLLLFTSLAFFISCSKNDSNTNKPANSNSTTETKPSLFVDTFSPLSAKVGETVTINGVAFGTDINAITIKFGTAAAVNPSTATDTKLTVNVPSDATTGQITVYVGTKSYVTTSQFEVVVAESQPVTPIDYSGYNKITYTGSATLSEPRAALAAAGIGDKILFAGGGNGSLDRSYGWLRFDNVSSTVDIYTISTNSWTTAHLSQARQALAGAAAGNKIVFAGGFSSTGYSDVVDIYDVTTGIWTASHLSKPRVALTATASGNKIYFAGGEGNDLESQSTIDIYDVESNKWSTATLANGVGFNIGSASTGGKLFFVGQNFSDIYLASTFTLSDHVITSGNKSTCVGAGINGVAIFAGSDNAADILVNGVGNTWLHTKFSSAKGLCAAAAAGTKIVFAGGTDGLTYTANADVYDVNDRTFTTLQLANARAGLAGASASNKIIFAGGQNNGVSNMVDIFTISQ